MLGLELIRNIGNEVCEECGPDRDCGIDNYYDCDRIVNAMKILDEFLKERNVS